MKHRKSQGHLKKLMENHPQEQNETAASDNDTTASNNTQANLDKKETDTRISNKVKYKPLPKKPSAFTYSRVAAFAILFGVLGVIGLKFSHAATTQTSTGTQITLNYHNFDPANSINASVIGDNSKSPNAIQIANSTNQSNGVAAITANGLTGTGYSVCLTARAASGTSTGSLSAKEFGSSPIGSTLASVAYTESSTSYQQIACLSIIHNPNTYQGVEFFISDTASNTKLDISNLVITPGATVENFSSYTQNLCFPDGTTFGQWTSTYNGYGCTQIKTASSQTYLDESPKASTSASETHASLVLGQSHSGPIAFNTLLTTFKQLRTGSAPNPWEVAWVVWNYTDDNHFYYFTPKTNGWELGKEDPAYPGSQRFLADSSSPSYPIGPWYKISIFQDSNNKISAYVNDQLITTFTDTQTPYTSGRPGFYNEDSHVGFTNYQLTK